MTSLVKLPYKNLINVNIKNLNSFFCHGRLPWRDKNINPTTKIFSINQNSLSSNNPIYNKQKTPSSTHLDCITKEIK
jgi:hypothetical protein